MARYRAEHSYHLQLWQAQWLRACSLRTPWLCSVQTACDLKFELPQCRVWQSPVAGQPATIGRQILEAKACLQGGQQGCYGFGAAAGGGVVAKGGIRAPLQYTTTVEGPLRVSGQILRTRECADHHLILSTSSTPPAGSGAKATPCQRRILRL